MKHLHAYQCELLPKHTIFDDALVIQFFSSDTILG
jgi:hypothetical protein